MITITLPDNSQRQYEESLTIASLASDIAPSLGKKAIAGTIDGTICDLHTPITQDAAVRIITPDNDDPEALYVLRHSCAHVLAEAICDLFPGTALAYGPPIDDGFYYDMAVPKALSEEDFPAIEKRMKEIIKANRPFTRIDCDRETGMARAGDNKYKQDNAERAIAAGSDTLSFYVTGEDGTDWEDLCAGPHVPRTGMLKAFKIMSVAGSYWHGDQSSDQLTRVYGTCFADKQGLANHLKRIEEAKKRDHRRIGKEMNLFHIDEDNPGQIFWHDKGWTIYQTVENYIRENLKSGGYYEVRTPNLQPQSLWEKSGHWAKYRDHMFITYETERGSGHDEQTVSVDEAEQQAQAGHGRCFSLKPMNCPGHIEIFKNTLRSHRELPYRIAEFGSCVRYEPSGALHGIMRVRGFVQDDGHIFCTEEQVGPEVASFCDMLKKVYKAFGFDAEAVAVKFSTRPEMRVGSDEEWDRAEAALAEACKEAGLHTVINPGEGAFYGPKLEFTLIDCLGREWQCGTIQVDYLLTGPDRLNATYVAEDGSRKHPILLHRAICGSLERFIGILIEQYAGKLPLWLAPEQIRLLTVTDALFDYANDVLQQLQQADIRATIPYASDKLGAKIRKARQDRVNYFAVIGEAEAEAGTVALQRQDGSKVGSFTVDELISMLNEEIENKVIPAVE